MELVCKIHKLSEIKQLQGYTKYVMLEEDLISKETIEELISNKITPILSYFRMMPPFELEPFEAKLKELPLKECIFYITDLGLAHLLKRLGYIQQVIYDPVTMITNHLDAKKYYSYGFLALGLSNEIPIADVNQMIESSKIRSFYQVFGSRLMLYSRRQLVSLYAEKLEKAISKGQPMVLRETTRKDILPIQETEHGTYIYRGYYLSLLKELTTLKVDYAFLNRDNLDFERYIEVVKLYKAMLQGADLSLALEKFTLLNLKTSDGFSYKDTVYNKEEF